MDCSRCENPAVIKRGHQMLCEKHYRFGQMRVASKRNNKFTPSHQQLEELTLRGMNCPDCNRLMNWRQKDGADTVATLQHYRNGEIAIVCLSCNSRHASMEGDSYRLMPKDHKHCPSCKTVKHESYFYSDNGRTGTIKRKSTCNICSDKKTNQWKEENREKYNAYQRAYRAKRKEQGRPITRND